MESKDQKHIWDYFQGEGAESFAGAVGRLKFLAGQVGEERVLSIGVGDGTFERAALAAGAELHCLDPGEAAISRLRAELDLGERAQVGFAEKIPFADGSMDAVVISELLEHLDDVTLAASLKEIRRVLRPGGRVVGTVPAREELARQMVVCPHCRQRFHRWGHARSFDIDSLRRTLGEWFTIDKVSERLFVTWSTLNWKGKLSAWVRLILHKIGIHGSDESIWFVAVKDESAR